MRKHIAIAGGGFAGAVLARKFAETDQYRVTVYEERRQVGGICFTERDEETDIMVHHFGPHIFHTNKEHIWEYINQWGKFENYQHQVKAHTNKGIFSLPLNLQSLNQFFDQKLSPNEARDLMGSKSDSSLRSPKNFEDHALKTIGQELYRIFFQNYIRKKWDSQPSRVSTLSEEEIRIRFNYQESYFDEPFQGVPLSGYTEIIRRILDHQHITVRLGQKLEPQMKDQFDHVFWSGPMDGFYRYKAGRLGYRTLKFEKFVEAGDFQGVAVINYCGEDVPFYRIIEHKHLTPWETHEKTICFKEFSAPCGEQDFPVMPVQSPEDLQTLAEYERMTHQDHKVTFLGRLGTYRHLEIDQMIQESLDLAETCLSTDIKNWPKFSHKLPKASNNQR